MEENFTENTHSKIFKNIFFANLHLLPAYNIQLLFCKNEKKNTPIATINKRQNKTKHGTTRCSTLQTYKMKELLIWKIK